MSTTLKDRQRLAVIPNDQDSPMTEKDRQRHSATGNDYMETETLKVSTDTFCLHRIRRP